MSIPGWVTDWLTADRLRKYLDAAGGDVRRALDLYEWNSDVASAFLHDLGHLEIGLRNAYDHVLRSHPHVRHDDWLSAGACQTLFPPHFVRQRGKPVDKNATPRKNVELARQRSGLGRPGVGRGKCIAELTFGFWTYLSDDLHEKTLWVPALHKAFAPGSDRRSVHSVLTRLRTFRNRVAHHESVFDHAPENQRRSIMHVAKLIAPELAEYIKAHSRLEGLIRQRP